MGVNHSLRRAGNPIAKQTHHPTEKARNISTLAYSDNSFPSTSKRTPVIKLKTKSTRDIHLQFTPPSPQGLFLFFCLLIPRSKRLFGRGSRVGGVFQYSPKYSFLGKNDHPFNCDNLNASDFIFAHLQPRNLGFGPVWISNFRV